MLPKVLFNRRRIEIRPSAFGIQNPIYAARTRYLRTIHPLSQHVHRDVIEIFYIASGKQVLSSAGTIRDNTAGDIFVNFPGEEHGSADAPQERNILYWFQVNVAKRDIPLAGLSPERSSTVIDSLLGLPRCFPGSDRIRELFDALILIGTEHPADPLTFENRFVALMLETIACGRRSPKRRESQAIRAARAFIDLHLREGISADGCALAAGLSRSRFQERFTRETGQTLNEYILRKKIDAAMAMIASGASVTDTAYHFGFSSSQYFATVYKRFTGRAPKRSRKTMRME